MLLVAFYRRDFQNLFIMMLIQMGFKQFLLVVLGWVKPLMKSGSKLGKIKEEYKHVTDRFEDEAKITTSQIQIKSSIINALDKTGNKENDDLSIHGNELNDKSIDKEGLIKDQVEENNTTRSDDKGVISQEEKRNVAEYQAKRDHVLNKDQDDILLDYMELVVQFGYVMFFSSVFPLAGALSMICNYFEMSQAINNLKYKKKFKAEVSVGIGNFTGCLGMISTFSIMINAFLLCFTSSVFKKLFTGNDVGWDVAFFLTFIFLVEHLIMIIKTLIEFSIPAVPEFIKTGELERSIVSSQLSKKIKDSKDFKTKF